MPDSNVRQLWRVIVVYEMEDGTPPTFQELCRSLKMRPRDALIYLRDMESFGYVVPKTTSRGRVYAIGRMDAEE